MSYDVLFNNLKSPIHLLKPMASSADHDAPRSGDVSQRASLVSVEMQRIGRATGSHRNVAQKMGPNKPVRSIGLL